MSVDPITKQYPELTPCQYASNSPILFIDLDGLEKALPWYLRENKHGGKPVLTFGLGNLQRADRIDDYHNYHGVQKGGVFVVNTLISAWNNVADTWNNALDGQTSSDMVAQSVRALGDMRPEDFKHVETWENLGGAALSAVLAKKLTQSQFSAKLPSGTKTNGLPIQTGSKLAELQSKFDVVAAEKLLPKYLKDDPNLKFGYTGSFETGKVGNPSKATFGQAIDLNKFDIDFWIESDILHKKYGQNLRADPEFRKILSETPGFEGLKPNKEGFSIKFKPSSK